MNQNQIKLLRMQSLMVRMPWEYPDITDHFTVAGYSAGKTSGLAMSAIELISRYWKYPVNVGLFSPTLTFMKKTFTAELEKYFIQSGTAYTFNKQENIIHIGAMKLILIPTDQPKDIYGHNLSASLVDELDELKQDTAIAANEAINERTRIDFPDGKKPFSVYATTAQGYRGTYQIIEDLKDKGIGYTHVRGLTKDNIYGVSPSYYKKLYKLYDENERLAFLEGMFVNLTAGRVYPGYNESESMVDQIEVRDDDTVYVGQDLNAGFSKATAAIIRDGILYGVHEWSFKSVSLAPKEIRKQFPTQEIYWFPDASGKEIMAGYTKEIADEGIKVRFGTVNPSVLERIFIVNKMFQTGKSKIVRTLKMLPIALKTRQYNDAGDPEKGKGEKAPDHIMDSWEYMVWRVVSMKSEFSDLWHMTATYRRDKK